MRIGAAPVDGAANAELVDTLARALDLPRRAVTITAGADLPHQARARRGPLKGRSPAPARARIPSRLNARPVRAPTPMKPRRVPSGRAAILLSCAGHQPRLGAFMITADFLIEDADLVATCAGDAPRRGAAQGPSPPCRAPRWPASRDASSSSGPPTSAATPSPWPHTARVLEGRGRTVVPGFVDPHTHLVYAGDRRDELQRRLAGATLRGDRRSGRRHRQDGGGDASRPAKTSWWTTARPRLARCSPTARPPRRSRAATA